jgi:hypothetical protein
MTDPNQPETIGEVLDEIGEAGNNETVSVDEVVEQIGEEAFGPLLLVPALILVTPVSSIPGTASTGSLIISLIAAQIVLGRKSLWLPGFLRRRRIKRGNFDRAIGYLRRPASVIDSLTGERLFFLTQRPWVVLPATICTILVFLAPAFETVPFSVSIAAFAVALIAVGMVAKDGLMILLGLGVMGGAGYAVFSALI